MKTSAILITALLLAIPLARAQNETYGTIKATTKLRPDGSKSTTIVDPEKRTAEETIWDNSGKPTRKITYLLGDGDLAVGAIFSDAKNKVIYRASYKRDGYGHIAETSFSSPEGKYLGRRLFFYGPGDAVSRIEDYDANGLLISPPQQGSAGKSAKKRR
ncbi:MAG: hypothetical protein ABIY47_03960 [Opitutaceae bacterium]